MNGSFGVFCGPDLVSGEFWNDDDADRHMRDLVELGEYDAVHLTVLPICDDYDVWHRMLGGLRKSRRLDRMAERGNDDVAA